MPFSCYDSRLERPYVTREMERARVHDFTSYFGVNVMTGGPFLESPVNFSGPISDMQIKFLRIRVARISRKIKDQLP